MKYILIILMCFIGLTSYGQVQKVQRSTFGTQVDSSLAPGKNLIIPVFRSFVDLSRYQVLDSSGRIIFLRDSNAVFVRTNQHTWERIGTGGSSPAPKDTLWLVAPLYANATFDTMHISEASPDSSGYLSSGNFVYFSAKPDSVVTNSTGDSLFNYVAGVVTYAAKLAGGGSGATLQQAFDNAPSVYPQINTGTNIFAIQGTDGANSVTYYEQQPTYITNTAAGTLQVNSIYTDSFNTQMSSQYVAGSDTGYYNTFSVFPKKAVLYNQGDIYGLGKSVMLGINTLSPSATLHLVSPDTSVFKIYGLGNTALSTDSALVIGTDGNVKKAPKGITGAVTSVTGTTNRITSTGGATPAIDISSSYVGQSSITTLGTVTTGVWNGTAIANANLANSTISGISLGSNLNNLSIAAELISGGATTYNGSAAKSIAIQSGSVTNTMLAGSIDLTTKVTGTLPVANGGTGVTSSTGSTSVVLSASPTLTGTVTADTIKPKLIRLPQTAGAQTQGTQLVSFDANNTAVTNGVGWGSTRYIYSDATNSIKINATILKLSGIEAVSSIQDAGAGLTSIALNSTGLILSKNVADGNTAVTLSNPNASATGLIAAFSSTISSTALTVDRNGRIGQYGTFTAIGTTGAQTINKPTGVVNFAAAATSLVVTNSLVTTSSVIMATIQTNDATMKSVQCVPASGSFTIYANAAATGTTAVYWEVKAIN